MLDLAGYTPDRPLYHMRLLEPSFGNDAALDTCIRAIELHRDTFETTRDKLHSLLLSSGFGARESKRLLSVRLFQGDFLLAPLEGHFDFVVGNPPYVRQELIAVKSLAVCRMNPLAIDQSTTVVRMN